MKRYISACLAALLVLGCVSPVQAAEEPAEALTLYQQYGPWGEWSQQQQDTAEAEWSEQQWEDYWMEYQQWSWTVSDQFYTDRDMWETARYEDGSENQWLEALRQEKAEMGMPYPDGINVSLNGKYLDFGGVEPTAVGGAAMVPFRAFLEAVGGRVSYEHGRITAVLESGDTITMSIDSAYMEYTVGERIETLDLGAAPYTSGGRTYIPVRAAGEALGLDVCWDSVYQTVYLTDYEALIAELNRNLTAANEIYAAMRAGWEQQAEQTRRTGAELTLAATLYGEKKHDTAKMSISADGLEKDGSFRCELSFDADLGGMEDTLFSSWAPEGPEVLKQMENGSLTLLYDDQTGMAYYKGTLLPALSGGTLPDDSWVSQQTMGGLSGQELAGTLGELLVEQYAMGYQLVGYYAGGESPWEAVMEQSRDIRLLLDDGNFTRTASGEQVRYIWKADLVSLALRAGELGVLDDWMGEELGQAPTLDMHAEITLRSGVLDRITGEGRLGLEGLGVPVRAGITLDAAPDHLVLKMDVTGSYIGKVEVNLSATGTQSSETLVTTPPEGERVESYEVFSGLRLPGVPADFGTERYVRAVLDARYGKAWDAEYLTALGADRANMEAEQREKDVAAFCGAFLMEELDPATEEEIWALLQEIYAKTDYTVRTTEDGTVEVTARPLDVFQRIREAYWQYMDNSGYGEEENWNQNVLQLCREQLDQAEYAEQENVDVEVSQWQDGTIALATYELEMLHSGLILPAAPGSW